MKSLCKSIACVLGVATMIPVSLHGQGTCGPDNRCAPSSSPAKPVSITGLRGTSVAKKDIVDTAVAAGSFNTLAAALKAAGLVDALKGKGPFTVFAPTDEAFAKLPAGTIENLLKPENKARLTEILTYHVVAGELPLSKALAAGEGTTLQGSKVNIRFDSGKVQVGESNLVNADIKTSNGVIHVIDTVLIPSAPVEKTRQAAPGPAFTLSIQRVDLPEDGTPAIDSDINITADDIQKLVELRNLLNAAKERE